MSQKALTKYQIAEKNSRANLSKGRIKTIPKPRLNHKKLPILIQQFLEGATARQAAEVSGFSKASVNRFIKALRETKPSCLFISDYQIVPGRILPVYELGYEKDVKMPKNLTQSERSKRYRAKKKMIQTLQALAGKGEN